MGRTYQIARKRLIAEWRKRAMNHSKSKANSELEKECNRYKNLKDESNKGEAYRDCKTLKTTLNSVYSTKRLKELKKLEKK